MKKVVVIGGGTGTYTVLSGLKEYDYDITAIVTVADSGGSTGRLRDEFGYLPVGDLRMALVALADANGDSNILRELFLYRFEKGSGLTGHNFGNLFLTALTEMFGSEDKAFEHASKILRIKGHVLPITREKIDLIAEYSDGSLQIGEKFIDEPLLSHNREANITKLRIQPHAKINDKAAKAIKEADLILLGPGDLYTSVLANFVVKGTSNVLRESKAKIVFTLNLINKYGQTTGFTGSDYINELKKYLKRSPDFVLVNSAEMSEDILERYSREKGFPVEDDLPIESDNPLIIRKDLLANELIKQNSGDIVTRSLIRHDSAKIAEVVASLLN